MSDKQTTAVILLVILSFVFYLYHTGDLVKVVSIITTGNANPTASLSGYNIPSIAAYNATNAQVAGVSYSNFSQGADTGYTLNSIFDMSNPNVVNYNPPTNNSGNLTSLVDLASIGSQAGLF